MGVGPAAQAPRTGDGHAKAFDFSKFTKHVGLRIKFLKDWISHLKSGPLSRTSAYFWSLPRLLPGSGTSRAGVQLVWGHVLGAWGRRCGCFPGPLACEAWGQGCCVHSGVQSALLLPKARRLQHVGENLGSTSFQSGSSSVVKGRFRDL